eukprot:8754501-Pyramimonas_sp.AAC.1
MTTKGKRGQAGVIARWRRSDQKVLECIWSSSYFDHNTPPQTDRVGCLYFTKATSPQEGIGLIESDWSLPEGHPD